MRKQDIIIATNHLSEDEVGTLYDKLYAYAYGARSFSIRRADDTSPIHDAGDDFEQITGKRYGGGLNADNTSNDSDDRSENKGHKPEALASGVLDGRRYAFIGLERTKTPTQSD